MAATDESTVRKQEVDDSVESLHRDIEKEFARIGSRTGVDSKMGSYKPALDEASMYLDKYFLAESAQEAFDAIYNADYSIGYYLAELSEQ